MEYFAALRDFFEPLVPLNADERHVFVHRIIYNNQTIYSKDYTRVKTRNSFTVKFLSSAHSTEFGFVQTFLRVHNFYLAIVQPLKVLNRGLPLSNSDNLPRRLSKYSPSNLAMHMHKVDMAVTLPFVAIPIKNILGKCVFIQISDDPRNAYVSEFPNLSEGD